MTPISKLLDDLVALCRGEITYVVVPFRKSVIAQLKQMTKGNDADVIKNGFRLYHFLSTLKPLSTTGATSEKQLVYRLPGHELTPYKLPRVKLAPRAVLGMIGVAKIPTATKRAIDDVAAILSISPVDVLHNSVLCYQDLIEIVDRGGEFFWEVNGELEPVALFADD